MAHTKVGRAVFLLKAGGDAVTSHMSTATGCLQCLGLVLSPSSKGIIPPFTNNVISCLS